MIQSGVSRDAVDWFTTTTAYVVVVVANSPMAANSMHSDV
jgi:hypothetical protein